ncbi:putative wlbA [Enterobacteriaceae bacterium ATCC 29904]|nr:putative wlbA [Enterobacteriaceae bacterium ATCC 29904]
MSQEKKLELLLLDVVVFLKIILGPLRSYPMNMSSLRYVIMMIRF